jgi:hypothetical protein
LKTIKPSIGFFIRKAANNWKESNKAYVKEVVDLPTEAFQKQRC